MSKKTIKINPELFQISSEKTKKNREKKQRPLIPPIINPNSIKKQLLNKIKEHKSQERKDLEKKQLNTDHSTNFSDEFQDSIEYLSSLSKQKKENERNSKNEEKNFYSYSEKFDDVPYVEIDWPEEFNDVYVNSTPIKINETIDNNVPYGCLKNGSKPTYRAWKENQTRKNYQITPLESKPNLITEDAFVSTIPEKIQPNAFVAERERKLAILKNKFKEQQEEEKEKQLFNTPLIVKPALMNNVRANETLSSGVDASIKEEPQTIAIKRTIRRKYKLGKSTKYRRVGVLIKDKQTRKRIIDAEKELKKKSIQDVKKYLKDRGLIKAGSNAPNDVLRKTFESAMLSGEIANVNRDTLMHNFLNEVNN